MSNWINMRVRLNDTWGSHAQESLATPLGPKQLPEFSMRARHLRDASGARTCAHYSIDLASGFLGDGWQGANFIPIGTQDVKGISGLKPWAPSEQGNYRKVIEAAKAKLSDSRTRRLEGIVPHLTTAGVGYNKVKLFYIPDAVVGPTPALVVVYVVPYVAPDGSVSASQDGFGHGPPD